MEEIVVYAEEVRRFVGQRVANSADAEDIAQQTLCVACEKVGTYRNGNLRAWLFTIARHLVVDHYRRQNRFQFFDVESVDSTERESALMTDPEGVRNLCDSRDRLRCYLCITDRLPLEEQVAVLCADLLGYRDRESAVTMGISLSTFKLVLHHARAHLQKATGKICLVVGHDATETPSGEAHPCVREGNANAAKTGKATNSAAQRSPERVGRVPGPCRSAPCIASQSGISACNAGLKCYRLIPALEAVRDRLLGELRAGLFYRALVIFGLSGGIPEFGLFSAGEAVGYACALL